MAEHQKEVFARQQAAAAAAQQAHAQETADGSAVGASGDAQGPSLASHGTAAAPAPVPAGVPSSADAGAVREGGDGMAMDVDNVAAAANAATTVAQGHGAGPAQEGGYLKRFLCSR